MSQEALERTETAGELALVWTEHSILVTHPASTGDINVAIIPDTAALYTRWWSPSLLWSRLRVPAGQMPKTPEVLLFERVTQTVDPGSWSVKGGNGTYATYTSGLQIINTNKNVAAVQDLIWRIKLEAMLFDASGVGLAAAALTSGGMLLHSTLRRRRRKRAGHCPACGYDLRASPGNCPECGRPAPGVSVNPA